MTLDAKIQGLLELLQRSPETWQEAAAMLDTYRCACTRSLGLHIHAAALGKVMEGHKFDYWLALRWLAQKHKLQELDPAPARPNRSAPSTGRLPHTGHSHTWQVATIVEHLGEGLGWHAVDDCHGQPVLGVRVLHDQTLPIDVSYNVHLALLAPELLRLVRTAYLVLQALDAASTPELSLAAHQGIDPLCDEIDVALEVLSDSPPLSANAEWGEA